MKILLPLVALFAMAASPAFADDGQVPRNSLARMGLGGMKVLSDAQGTAIRGESFTLAFSKARVGNTTQTQFRVGSNFASSSRFVASGGTIAGGGAFAFAY